jgi:hypothetical protein
MEWLLSNKNKVFKCVKCNREFDIYRNYVAHLKTEYSSIEEAHIKINNLSDDEIKCPYCSYRKKFISFEKGFMLSCGSSECKLKATKVVNGNIGRNKIKGFIEGYDEFVSMNVDFYKENWSERCVDIFDGENCEKNLRVSMLRKLKNHDLHSEPWIYEKECPICGNIFMCSYFDISGETCNSKPCVSSYYTYKNHTNNKSEDYENFLLRFGDIPSNLIDLSEKFCNWYIKNGDDYLFMKTLLFREGIHRKYEKFFDFVKFMKFKKKYSKIFFDKYLGFYILLKQTKQYFNNEYLRSLHNRKRVDKDNYLKSFDVKYCNCIACNKEFSTFQPFTLDDDLNFKFFDKKSKLVCSRKCYFEILKDNKPEYFGSPSAEERERASKLMRLRILNGEFTPCVTNSWCKSRFNVPYKGDIIPVRSSWEAVFLMCYAGHLKYETVRLSYFDDNGRNKIYLVDFVDEDNKIIFEVKPTSLVKERNNLIKEKVAREWCYETGYSYMIIDDEKICDLLKNRYNIERMIDSEIGLKVLYKLKGVGDWYGSYESEIHKKIEQSWKSNKS